MWWYGEDGLWTPALLLEPAAVADMAPRLPEWTIVGTWCLRSTTQGSAPTVRTHAGIEALGLEDDAADWCTSGEEAPG